MSNRNYLAVFLIVVIVAGLVIVGVYAFRQGSVQEKDKPADGLIGGQKDAHGCLVAAGYSWCEVKNKCLRAWEEPCLTAEDQSRIEAYFKENISALSPEPEVLGGKFYITRFRFTDDKRVTIDYEDGHIALVAEAVFTLKDGRVTVEEFTLVDTNGYLPEAEAGTEADRAGITAQFAEKYNVAPADISVQISDSRDGYFRGSVKLSPDEDAPGGYFLAKIVDNEYVIVSDGNGQIDCALVSDFPAGMADDCVEKLR